MSDQTCTNHVDFRVTHSSEDCPVCLAPSSDNGDATQKHRSGYVLFQHCPQLSAAVQQAGWAVVSLAQFGVQVGIPPEKMSNPAIRIIAEPALRQFSAAMDMIQTILSGGSNIILV